MESFSIRKLYIYIIWQAVKIKFHQIMMHNMFLFGSRLAFVGVCRSNLAVADWSWVFYFLVKESGAVELGGQGGKLPTHFLAEAILSFSLCPPTLWPKPYYAHPLFISFWTPCGALIFGTHGLKFLTTPLHRQGCWNLPTSCICMGPHTFALGRWPFL